MGPEGKSAIPVLTDLLQDKEVRIRLAAARALGSMGPEAKAAIPVLTELLRDKDEGVRQNAADALKRLDEKKE
jgi:HEAT repeat protein